MHSALYMAAMHSARAHILNELLSAVVTAELLDMCALLHASLQVWLEAWECLQSREHELVVAQSVASAMWKSSARASCAVLQARAEQEERLSRDLNGASEQRF